MRLHFLRFNFHHIAPAAIAILAIGAIVAGWPAILAIAVAAVLAVLLSDGIARPSSSLFYATVTHGPRDRQCVALSFDDGPDPLVTPAVLDTLASHNARATFFVIGRHLEAQPELARRMVNEGHVLGNHSWQHSRLQNFRLRRWQREEIERCEQAIDTVSPATHTCLYRPPMGLKIGELCRELWRRRLTLVAWSLHSRDTQLDSPEQIAERVLRKVRSGDIILLHDGHDLSGHHRRHCAQAVELILQGLNEQGLACVTIPELLEEHAQQSAPVSN